MRTVFNLLGPLTNPAGAPNQLIGVFDGRWLKPVAQVLNKLGSRHVLVVHSSDGLDEISCAAPTHFAELKNGAVHTGTIDPQRLGVPVGSSLSKLRAEDAESSLRLIRSALGNEPGPARDIVALNAGAALYVAGQAADLAGGVELARETLETGDALRRLEALAELSGKLAA